MRIWIDLKTSCLLSFLVPFLIGPGLGDSHLVTLFLFSLALFFSVINAFYVFAFFFVFVLLFCWCYFASSSFLYILFLTYQKKKTTKQLYIITSPLTKIIHKSNTSLPKPQIKYKPSQPPNPNPKHI